MDITALSVVSGLMVGVSGISGIGTIITQSFRENHLFKSFR